MKKIIVGLSLLSSMLLFATDAPHLSYCRGRGQEAIESQKELVRVGVARGEISKELQEYLNSSVVDMQKNHDYFCKGVRISNGPRLSTREQQLDLILKGFASGEINEDLADYFLGNLRHF